MKRLYFFIGLASLSMTGFSQKIDGDLILKPMPEKFTAGNAVTNDGMAILPQKAPGDEIYANNFDDANDWIIGAATTQGQWEFVSSTPADMDQYVGTMASASAGDGFALFNGLQYLIAQDVETQDATLELDSTFNFSLVPNVTLQFEQRMRTLNYDKFYVEFSLDGGSTWPVVLEYNDQYAPTEPDASGAQQSIVTNVTSQIGGQPSVRLRFRWVSDGCNFGSPAANCDNFGSGYGWMIDDLKLTEPQNNDLNVLNTYWSYGNPTTVVPYTMIPDVQLSDITIFSVVENVGASAQPGTGLTANVVGPTSNVYTGTEITVALSAQDTVSAGPVLPGDVSTHGTYDITYTVASDSIDSTPANNTSTGDWSFEVNEFVYARDNGSYEGYWPSQDADGDMVIDYQSEYQVDYEIVAQDTVYSLEVVISDETAVGTEIYYNIYDGAGNALYDGVSNAQPTYEITAADLTSGAGNEVWLKLPFTFNGNDGCPLSPVNGNVFTVAVGNEIDSLYVAASGTALSSEVLGDWYSAVLVVTQSTDNSSIGYILSSVPMIRMNFENTVGLEENNEVVNLGQNIPNPFNTTTAIPFSLINAGAVEFVVTDITGKIIETRDLGTLSAGSHSIEFDGNKLSGGTYFYSVIVDGIRTTKKLNIAK